jgi:hypothetical protein
MKPMLSPSLLHRFRLQNLREPNYSKAGRRPQGEMKTIFRAPRRRPPLNKMHICSIIVQRAFFNEGRIAWQWM